MVHQLIANRHAYCFPAWRVQGGLREVLARQRVALEGARLLVLNAAHSLDCVGHKQARAEIAAAKVAAPNVALQVIDAAIQVGCGLRGGMHCFAFAFCFVVCELAQCCQAGGAGSDNSILLY